jgi:hypothetical protein
VVGGQVQGGVAGRREHRTYGDHPSPEADSQADAWNEVIS